MATKGSAELEQLAVPVVATEAALVQAMAAVQAVVMVEAEQGVAQSAAVAPRQLWR